MAVLEACDSYAPRVEGVGEVFIALPTAGEILTSHSPVVVGKQGSFEVAAAGVAAPKATLPTLAVVPAKHEKYCVQEVGFAVVAAF